MKVCITDQLADALDAMSVLQCKGENFQMPCVAPQKAFCEITHLDVGRHALMEFYGGLVLKRQVDVPHQQHHQPNRERHAEGQAHRLHSASILT